MALSVAQNNALSLSWQWQESHLSLLVRSLLGISSRRWQLLSRVSWKRGFTISCSVSLPPYWTVQCFIRHRNVSPCFTVAPKILSSCPWHFEETYNSLWCVERSHYTWYVLSLQECRCVILSFCDGKNASLHLSIGNWTLGYVTA